MGSITYEKKNNIAYITLNRPDILNAINRELADELRRVSEDFQHDPDCRVAIISAAGEKAFCVGADVKDPPHQQSNTERAAPDLRMLPGVWKPVIGAIHGYCLGMGLALALECDLRIAADNALFGLPEVKLGRLVVFREQVVRAIGLAPAMYLLLTGQSINAQKALKIGLVHDVVPVADLKKAAEELAKVIAGNPPLVVQALKQAVLSESQPVTYVNDQIHSLSKAVRNSEDFEEGKRAFLEKRKPVWKGR